MRRKEMSVGMDYKRMQTRYKKSLREKKKNDDENG